jgi:hypothetical protein
MTQVAAPARRAANSNVMAGFARFGLAARGFSYLVIGWLAVEIARGHGREQANQKGALADLARHSYGLTLLWLLGLGFAAYSIWRLSETAFGVTGEGRKVGPRLQSLFRGIAYAVLCVTTFSFIAGRPGQGQSQQQAAFTARLLRHTGGQWLVAIVGLVVIAVGIALIVEGVTRKFTKHLRMRDLRGATRAAVVRLGMVGTIARGAVFAVAGGLVVDAAITANPDRSTGLDGALRTLADRAYGPWILGAFAAGLIAFGLYGFACARWART